ncbi:hypothetical protein HPP92_004395 [Vanilla planifolia]|uniref:Uncharacterized protein n=1 Tax=Vanilla planifolia TaxID=51239 RepID=A0A835VGD4_VANPL|nr:hypothetical protein HPP92_004395 [Vanilla planifolia]
MAERGSVADGESRVMRTRGGELRRKKGFGITISHLRVCAGLRVSLSFRTALRGGMILSPLMEQAALPRVF